MNDCTVVDTSNNELREVVPETASNYESAETDFPIKEESEEEDNIFSTLKVELSVGDSPINSNSLYPNSVEASIGDFDGTEHFLSTATSRQSLDREIYKCDYCLSGFVKKGCLRYHILKNHYSQFSNDDQWENLLHNCEICFAQQSPKRRNPPRSSRGQTSIIISDDEFEAEEKRMRRDKSFGVNYGNFTCNVCGRTYRFESMLLLHMKRHENVRTYKCQMCSADFKTKGSLKKHNVAVHLNERRIKCPLCSKGFNFNNSLKKHLEMHDRKNNVENPQNICHVCSRLHKSKFALKNHMKRHDDTRPYFNCMYCPSKLRAESSFKVHMLKHTNEKRFDCTLCDKKFHFAGDLQRHMASHTDERSFVCEHCGSTFKRNNSYQRHKQLHSRPPKPMSFPCVVCGEKFSYYVQIKVHLESHTEEEKQRINYFRCELCNTKYTSKKCYNAHLRIKHPELVEVANQNANVSSKRKHPEPAQLINQNANENNKTMRVETTQEANQNVQHVYENNKIQHPVTAHSANQNIYGNNKLKYLEPAQLANQNVFVNNKIKYPELAPAAHQHVYENVRIEHPKLAHLANSNMYEVNKIKHPNLAQLVNQTVYENNKIEHSELAMLANHYEINKTKNPDLAHTVSQNIYKMYEVKKHVEHAQLANQNVYENNRIEHPDLAQLVSRDIYGNNNRIHEQNLEFRVAQNYFVDGTKRIDHLF